jgi:hypothetical protein
MQGARTERDGEFKRLAHRLLAAGRDVLTRTFSTMEALASDFSSHWLAAQAADSTAPLAGARDDEPLTPSLQEALAALVERVNAARSIV